YKKDGAWRSIGSADLRVAVEELSLGLRALGVEKGDRVAILSENRPEWAIADLATLCAGAADVPVYATLTPPQVAYILNDSQARVCFVSNAAQAAKLAQVKDQLKSVREVIRMDEAPLPGTLSFAEVREKGRLALAADPQAVRHRAGEAGPEDLAT